MQPVLNESRRGSETESSGRPLLPQNRSVRPLLPATDDVVFSTRGQTLPVLISQLSGSVPNRTVNRRGSFYIGPDDVSQYAQDPETARTSSELERPKSRDGQQPRRHSWFPQPGTEGGGMWNDVRNAEQKSRAEVAAMTLMTPQMRSQRLIGNSNPRYRWERYWTTDEELKRMKRPIREYYERNNSLIQQYTYIDRLLDSSLPHDLIQEYHYYNTPTPPLNIPSTICEEPSTLTNSGSNSGNNSMAAINNELSMTGSDQRKIKRTPKNLYKVHERTPLLADDEQSETSGNEVEAEIQMPQWEPEEETDSNDRIVTVAIYINLSANTILLVLKIIVTILTSSVSVLAALVDAILDFLSTAIVWTTTRLISARDYYQYPIGRSRLEPIGVLVFSIIMITAFAQVAIEGFGRLTSPDHKLVQLSTPAILIMASTVLVKGLCWFWCRLVKNSSVQALAQDAATDVVFNIFSIIFPLIGYYANIWWLDPLGGILLSVYVIYAWSQTTMVHIRNLSGAAATANERNVLLYLTMRFAKTIKQIQGLQAYHAGDRLNVEVDLVLDENMSLRDAHDLGESLQYVLESVPTVERAFVHLDYASWNLPTHMRQHN